MPAYPYPIRDRLAKWTQVDPDTGCWLFTGVLAPGGYGRIKVTIARRVSRDLYAHRVSYEAYVGPIPDGLTLDHLCRVRNCINPAHLEPVTQKENTYRAPDAPATLNASKTHCPRGHEYSGTNLIVQTKRSGHQSRACRQCGRDRVAALRST